jgi:hypothetical protein
MDAKTSLIQPTFLFDDRKRFDAECEHDVLRSSLQSDMDILPTTDPWKQPPVDFTMINFHPNRKKNKNLSSSSLSMGDISPREKQSQNSRTHNSAVMRPFAVTYQNKHLGLIDDKDDNKFLLNTRIKYNQVKRMLNTEQYQNPKLHDFRQVIFIIIIYYLKFFLFKIVSKYKRIRFIRISYYI